MVISKLFFSSLLSLSLQAISQQTKLVLPLPETAISTSPQKVTNTLTIEAEKIGTVKSFELIDNTGDSLILGYLGIAPNNNDRVAVTTPLSKAGWLWALTGDHLIKAFITKGTNGIYILNDLGIGKTDAGNYICLKAHVYESRHGSNTYQLVNNIDTFTTDNNSDISSIGTVISNIMGSSLFVGMGVTPLGTGKGFTRQEIIKTEKDSHAFISNNQFTTGIYMSYDEIKTGRPTFDQFFIGVDEKNNTVQVNSFTQSDSTLRPVKPWGIAVNNELYLYKDNKLYPLEAKGNQLFLSKYIDPEVRKNNARFWKMTIGDRLGEKYKNPFDNINELRLTNYRNKGVNGEAIKINSDTGAPEL